MWLFMENLKEKTKNSFSFVWLTMEKSRKTKLIKKFQNYNLRPSNPLFGLKIYDL